MKTRIRVALVHCFLARFDQGEAGKYWDYLALDEPLELVRDRADRQDARAVKVQWVGATLGYLPQEAAYIVGQMMDRGDEVRARITSKRPSGDPATRVQIEISVMVDPVRAETEEASDRSRGMLAAGLAWLVAGRAIQHAKQTSAKADAP
jgi:hypothetical protein